MPKLATKPEATITTKAEVELSPKLKTKLQHTLKRYQSRKAEIDALNSLQDLDKTEIETLFADAGEWNTLCNGVKVDDISLKEVTGGTTPKFNKLGLMKRFKITTAAWDSFVTRTPKKDYLKVTLPTDKEPTNDE